MIEQAPSPLRPRIRRRRVAALLCLAGVVAAISIVFREPARDTLAGNVKSGNPAEQQADGSESISEAQADEAWETEEFADAAQEQLNRLGDLLTQPAADVLQQLQDVASADVRSSVLRPTELSTEFESATFTVFRCLDPESEQRIVGLAALRDHLVALSEPLAECTHVHFKFKIISVEVRPESCVETDVIFQVSGDTSDSAYQQNAMWRCVWKQTAKESPVLLDLELIRYEEVTGRSATGILYADCTESVFRNETSFRDQLIPGIDYWRSAIQSQYGVYPYGHHGIAVGDVNGDGLDDIYACQPSGLPNRLYVQNPDGTVTDIAAQAGVDWLDRSRGALILDFDNDGDQDLAVVHSELVLFLANDGNAHFTEQAAIQAMEPGSLAAADYDLDGDLDVFVANYGDRFLSVTNGAGPEPYHDANNGGPNVLLRNDGDWNFSNVTTEVGLDMNNTRWSLAASWEDFDNDGDPDLYVANDFGRNNLYRNDGGHFVDIAASSGVEDIAAGMSASWADFDHDGRMDLYVGNMFSSAGLRIATQDRFQNAADSRVRSEFQRHARGNSLFRNSGDDTFEDVSVDAGVTIGRWAWGSNFVDINNDGWEDVIVANGFVTGHQTKDL